MAEKRNELYYVKRWMIAGCLLLVVILCQGCASAPPLDMSDYPYTYEVHDNASFEATCDRLGRNKCPKYAFMTSRNDVYQIHIRDRGGYENACSLEHEKWHIVDYLWHDFKSHSGCAPSPEKQREILGG